MASAANADTYTLTKGEQEQIFEEAENWIDDMPEGLQDRLSDAVNHAMHGFYSEINYFREFSDTASLKHYPVTVQDINSGDASDIPLRIYAKKGIGTQSKLPVLIYFHGGGWSVGSLNATEKFCRALASEGNVKVISVDYPLAPEHPYPSGINKSVEAVDYVYANAAKLGIDPARISLGGDGAGGNIALNVYFKIVSDKSVKSIVLYYPLLQTGGTLSQDSKREYGRGFGFDSRLWEIFTEVYKGKDMPPVNLPDLLLISAGRDIIIDQEKDFVAGNPSIKYIEFSGALHGFITDGHQNTAFNKAVSLTDLFLTQTRK